LEVWLADCKVADSSLSRLNRGTTPATIRSMTDTPPRERLVVGVMTGTSIDGMDAALVRIDGVGLNMWASLVRHLAAPLGELKRTLQSAASQKPMTAGDLANLAWKFGMLHADVIAELVGEVAPDLICVHGQTVFHQPPVSWQLVSPAPIAERFKCPVVFDMRQADLAAGGQGAPITPLADWILFRHGERSRAIINLGGFCNVTTLPQAHDATARTGKTSSESANELAGIRGFDVCACNQILDAVAVAAMKQPFDADGQAARAGRASPQAAAELCEVLDKQRRGGRSLGTGDEAAAWIERHLSTTTANDLAASAVHAIAQTIAAAVTEHSVDELVLAGGGARNQALAELVQRLSEKPCMKSDELGMPIEAREAACFAVLGALCADGVPITLPHVTGCRTPAPVSGSWVISHGEARPKLPSVPSHGR
jgi:1,6-anhydro-N-acetylmuramate kinase